MNPYALRNLLLLLSVTTALNLFSQGADFGDCPDPPYPTMIMSNGAQHLLLPGIIYFGSTVDGEPNGQIAAGAALGDDLNGDDEDGIILNSWLLPGTMANITVIASAPCFMNAWIDFNGNGTWADAGEQIFAGQPLNPGHNHLQFMVPPTALPGLFTYARFRCSSVIGLPFVGAAPDGEVEDYQVFIGNPLPIENIIDPDPSLAFTQNEISLSMVPGQQFAPPALLLAAYNDEPGTGGPGIGISYSHDAGLHWNNTQLPYPQNPFSGNLMIDMFDPSSTTDLNGNAYVSYISTDNNWIAGPASGLFVTKSIDAGITWSNPAIVSIDAPPIGSPDPNYRFNDRDHMTCDRYPQSPYSNNIYITWIKDRGWNMPLPLSDIYFSASSDGGSTFRPPVIVNEVNHNMGNMPVVDVAKDGTIYILWIDYNVQTGGTGTLFLDKSTNGGLTWGTDRFVSLVSLPPLHLNNNTDVLAKGAAILKVQPANPNELYIAYAADPDGAGPDEGDIFFIKSTDGGMSWNNPLRINNDLTTNDQVLPWMHVSPDGVITVVWYDRRTDPLDLQWDVYYSVSSDGGMSFSPSLKINAIPFLSPNTFKWGVWFGEYLGLITDYNSIYSVYTTSAFNTLGDVSFAKASKPVASSDYGDAPDPGFPTLFYNNGASHTLDGVTFLGTTVDAEPDGLPGTDASGDDNYGVDDEDGVTFPSTMFAGTTAILIVNASVQGYLNAWVDFNNNGNWGDAYEHVINGLLLNAGNNYVAFPIPSGAYIGNVYSRFRFSSVATATSDGHLPDGEVEDYLIEIKSNTEVAPLAFTNPCNLLVRPNPSMGEAVICFNTTQNDRYHLRIMNLKGDVLGEYDAFAENISEEIASGVILHDRNALKPGVYFVELRVENAIPCRCRMVILN